MTSSLCGVLSQETGPEFELLNLETQQLSQDSFARQRMLSLDDLAYSVTQNTKERFEEIVRLHEEKEELNRAHTENTQETRIVKKRFIQAASEGGDRIFVPSETEHVEFCKADPVNKERRQTQSFADSICSDQEEVFNQASPTSSTTLESLLMLSVKRDPSRHQALFGTEFGQPITTVPESHFYFVKRNAVPPPPPCSPSDEPVTTIPGSNFYFVNRHAVPPPPSSQLAPALRFSSHEDSFDGTGLVCLTESVKVDSNTVQIMVAPHMNFLDTNSLEEEAWVTAFEGHRKSLLEPGDIDSDDENAQAILLQLKKDPSKHDRILRRPTKGESLFTFPELNGAAFCFESDEPQDQSVFSFVPEKPEEQQFLFPESGGSFLNSGSARLSPIMNQASYGGSTLSPTILRSEYLSNISNEQSRSEQLSPITNQVSHGGFTTSPIILPSEYLSTISNEQSSETYPFQTECLTLFENETDSDQAEIVDEDDLMFHFEPSLSYSVSSCSYSMERNESAFYTSLVDFMSNRPRGRSESATSQHVLDLFYDEMNVGSVPQLRTSASMEASAEENGLLHEVEELVNFKSMEIQEVSSAEFESSHQQFHRNRRDQLRPTDISPEDIQLALVKEGLINPVDYYFSHQDSSAPTESFNTTTPPLITRRKLARAVSETQPPEMVSAEDVLEDFNFPSFPKTRDRQHFLSNRINTSDESESSSVPFARPSAPDATMIKELKRISKTKQVQKKLAWMLGEKREAVRERMTIEEMPELNHATTAEIVERITHPHISGNAYKDVLFLSHHTYISTGDLLELFVQRFHHSDVECYIHNFICKQQDIRTNIQIKVCLNLKYWFETYPEDFEKEKNRQHAERVVGSIARVSAKLAQQLHKALIKMDFPTLPTVHSESTYPEPIVSLNIGLEKLQLKKNTAEEFARQICIADFEIFQQINPREFLGQHWLKSKHLTPNLTALIERFNQINNWVQQCVLSQETASKRTKVVKRMLRICEHLEAMNNLNSLAAIHAGLCASPVYRLKKTFAKLDKERQKLLKRYSELFAVSNNKKNLRERTKTLSQPAMPHLALFLSDLVFIEDGNQSCCTNGKINFNKFGRLSERIQWIYMFQQNSFQFKRVEPVQEYLRARMSIIPEDVLYEVSLQLEPRSKKR